MRAATPVASIPAQAAGDRQRRPGDDMNDDTILMTPAQVADCLARAFAPWNDLSRRGDYPNPSSWVVRAVGSATCSWRHWGSDHATTPMASQTPVDGVVQYQK
jgi:hypothetical protein